MSSSGRFRVLEYPQNCVLRDKGLTKIFILNMCVAWWNPQIFIDYPQSTTLHPHFWILNTTFFIIQTHFTLIQTPFSILKSSAFIFGKKCGILYSKYPQYSVIFNKMSAGSACTTCSFFQVCYKVVLELSLSSHELILEFYRNSPELAIDTAVLGRWPEIRLMSALVEAELRLSLAKNLFYSLGPPWRCRWLGTGPKKSRNR